MAITRIYKNTILKKKVIIRHPKTRQLVKIDQAQLRRLLTRYKRTYFVSLHTPSKKTRKKSKYRQIPQVPPQQPQVPQNAVKLNNVKLNVPNTPPQPVVPKTEPILIMPMSLYKQFREEKKLIEEKFPNALNDLRAEFSRVIKVWWLLTKYMKKMKVVQMEL